MLCEMTPILREAARNILDDSPDMTCVGDETLAQVEQRLQSKQFDAMLLGTLAPGADEPGRHLLDINPLLKIVCVSPDGREAVLQERRLDRIRIKNVSFDRILAALREACAPERIG